MPLEIKVRAIADVSAVQQALDALEKNARIRVPIDAEQQLARRAQITEQLTTVMNRYNKALQLEKQNFKSSAFNNVRDEISQYRTSKGGIIDLDSLSQEAFAELEANLDRYARTMRQVNIEATEFTRNRSVERTINSEATALTSPLSALVPSAASIFALS